MRKIYTYRVLRYFPCSRSDEFFNVGIWLWDEQGNKTQIYIDKNQEHIKQLYKFPSIDKRALPFFLKGIKQETNVNAWYDNHLRFGEQDCIASEQSIDEVANILYEDYIGYKFHTKYIKERYKEANERTKTIYEKKFQTKFLLNPHNDYSFSLINKATQKEHYARFGSVNDKADIQDIMYFSRKSKNYTKMQINLLGIVSADKEEIKLCKEDFLTPNHIAYAPYHTDEESEMFFEKALQIA